MLSGGRVAVCGEVGDVNHGQGERRVVGLAVGADGEEAGGAWVVEGSRVGAGEGYVDPAALEGGGGGRFGAEGRKGAEEGGGQRERVWEGEAGRVRVIRVVGG